MKPSKWLIFFCFLALPALSQESLLIGPGDQLHIRVFDTPELEETVDVNDAGDIPLVLGGTIHLGGLTRIAAAQAIEKRLIEKNIMYHPQVLVTSAELGVFGVTVLGQVAKPGNYPIQTPRSILDVLALAGGLTELGDRNITIERRTTRERLSYFASNDSEAAIKASVLVYPGDRVLVPKTRIVYVLGDVGHAGGFPINSINSSTTILEVIAQAGGTNHSAVPNDAKLIHRTPDGQYTTTPIKLSSMQKGKTAG